MFEYTTDSMSTRNKMINFCLSDQRSYCIRVFDTNCYQFHRFFFLSNSPVIYCRWCIDWFCCKPMPGQNDEIKMNMNKHEHPNANSQTNKQTNAKHFQFVTKVHCPKINAYKQSNS